MEIRKINQSNKHYRIGKVCELEVLRLVSIGAYLEWDNEDGVLLPIRYLPEGVEVGDKLSVFVYHDNEGRIISTTLMPFAEVGEVAYLECISVSTAGAFLSWGIHKDLFVPFSEQLNRMIEGKSYLVYLYIDHVSGKIVGSAKLNKHIGNTLPEYKPGQEVEIIIGEHNEVGYRAIVDHQHWGMLYYDSLKYDLERGSKHRAYIIRTREDGRLDLSLSPVGYSKTEGDTKLIIEKLRERGGVLNIGDKSTAEEILRLTGLSKKSFKMAVGKLYKQQLVSISPYSIELNKKR